MAPGADAPKVVTAYIELVPTVVSRHYVEGEPERDPGRPLRHGRERQALGLGAARGAARLLHGDAVDTRQATDPTGGPSLAGGGAKRRFVITGQCGVPATALAVAANVTIVGPAANGDLRFGPSGFAAQTSTINFSMGRTRANNAVIGLTGDPLGKASPCRPTWPARSTWLSISLATSSKRRGPG